AHRYAPAGQERRHRQRSLARHASTGPPRQRGPSRRRAALLPALDATRPQKFARTFGDRTSIPTENLKCDLESVLVLGIDADQRAPSRPADESVAVLQGVVQDRDRL